MSAQNSLQKIDAAVASGQLSRDLGTIYKALSATNQADLPTEYQSSEMVYGKCGTDLMTEALAVIEGNPEKYGSYREALVTRPSTQFYIDTPGGHFRLHFDTSGQDSVPSADLNSNGIPDFIDFAMMAADSAWDEYVNNLGYYEPVSDLTQGGGLGLYDIYFQVIPYYGFTTPETAGPADWNDYSSFAKVHSRFSPGFPPNDDPDGDVYGALKVTIAHEFHHAIQFAYDVYEAPYFMEETSTCMEEVVFPAVNDNYNYLPFFFDAPETGLQSDNGHEYASFIWPKFLIEKYGIGILHDMWNDCRYNSAISAWSTNLAAHGSSLDKAFGEFARWNYFTGSRADTLHFEEGAAYPQVAIMAHHDVVPDSNNSSTLPPQPLASNYIIFDNLTGYSGILTFDFTGLNTAVWGLSYIVDYGNGTYDEKTISPLDDGKQRVSIANLQDVLRIIYIPSIGSQYGTQFNYTYNFHFRTRGDLDDNDNVSISDAVYGINYIFGGGPAPNPIETMDVDCSGTYSVSDVVYIINYIFASGPPPCN